MSVIKRKVTSKKEIAVGGTIDVLNVNLELDETEKLGKLVFTISVKCKVSNIKISTFKIIKVVYLTEAEFKAIYNGTKNIPATTTT